MSFKVHHTKANFKRNSVTSQATENGKMPGMMNHNSVNTSGIITSNHSREPTVSRPFATTRRPSPQQQQQQQKYKPQQQQQPQQQLHQCPRLGREKAVNPLAQSKHSNLTTEKSGSPRNQPSSPLSQPTTSKVSTPLLQTSSPSSPSTQALPSSSSSPSSPSLTPSLPPTSLSLSTLHPLSCSISAGLLSTTQLFPNNSALLTACGVPRPTSPQLSPNSKLASVFSSYPSLKASSKSFSFPPPSTSEVLDDDVASKQSGNGPTLLSPSSENPPTNLTVDSPTTASPALSLPSMLLSPPSPSFDSDNPISATNNNNNNIPDNVAAQPVASRLSSAQASVPRSQEEGGQGVLPVSNTGQHHQVVNQVQDAPQQLQCDSNTGTVESSTSERLNLPRDKTVVVPSSPPTPHRPHLVTQQATPVGPTRLAQIRQMKTKTMKLPELSETSEHENSLSTTDETTPQSPAHTVQPLPPQGSPRQQSRRSGLAALNSDRLPPTAKVMPQISVTDEDGADIVPSSPPSEDHQSTPLALPQAFLRKLGLSVEDDEKDVTVDQLSEKEVESKFVTLSLAFKTDKLTLDQRVIVQERARDIAEQNVDVELQGIRDALESLGDVSCDPEVRDVVEKIKLHIDVLEISAAKVSSRAEVFGAVQQERRLCKAMEVMVLYTENLRRIRAKEEAEVQEARKVLSERSGGGYSLDVESGGPSRRSMSVCGFAPGVRTMRRRSEVALPRILGGTGSPAPGQESDLFHTGRLFESNSHSNINQASQDEEGPKARFQSAVASTSMQHAVTATIRQASIEKQRSISVYAGSPFAPNSSVLGPTSVAGESSSGRPPSLRKTSPQPALAVTLEDEADSCAASETSTSETTTPTRKVSQDEQAYRKGFEQGLKAKLSDSLTELRDQQNTISRSLETVMDKVDQGESEDAEILSRPTRLESLVAMTAKVREFLLTYDWRSNKTAIRNLAGVAFLLLALLMMFLSPPVPSRTRASSIQPPSQLPKPPTG